MGEFGKCGIGLCRQVPNPPNAFQIVGKHAHEQCAYQGFVAGFHARDAALAAQDPDQFPWTLFGKELCSIKARFTPCSRGHVERYRRLLQELCHKADVFVMQDDYDAGALAVAPHQCRQQQQRSAGQPLKGSRCKTYDISGGDRCAIVSC